MANVMNQNTTTDAKRARATRTSERPPEITGRSSLRKTVRFLAQVCLQSRVTVAERRRMYRRRWQLGDVAGQ